MRFLFLSLCILFFSTKGFSGGSDFGNAAGEAESNFMYAYKNIGVFISQCLKLCDNITDSDRQLLQNITGHLKKEPDWLEFKGRVENGHAVFEYPFQQKKWAIAVTGSRVGDGIYINRHRIYTLIQTRTQKGEIKYAFKAMSVNRAIVVLVHELGHHHSSLSHGQLRSLGNKVASQVRDGIKKMPLSPIKEKRNISAYLFQEMDSTEPRSYPQLYISDGETPRDTHINLTTFLKSHLSCPETGETPQGAVLHGARWVGSRNSLRPYIDAPLVLFCNSSGKLKDVWGDRFLISMDIEKRKNRFWIRKDSVLVSYERCEQTSHCEERRATLKERWKLKTNQKHLIRRNK